MIAPQQPAFNRLGIFWDIQEERLHQNRKWGGHYHDVLHSAKEWNLFRTKYECLAGHAEQYCNRTELRANLIKIAALAVAQIEVLDRAS